MCFETRIEDNVERKQIMYAAFVHDIELLGSKIVNYSQLKSAAQEMHGHPQQLSNQAESNVLILKSKKKKK